MCFCLRLTHGNKSSYVCLFSSDCLVWQCYDLCLIHQQSLFDGKEDIAWVDFNRGDNEVCASSDSHITINACSYLYCWFPIFYLDFGVVVQVFLVF